MSLETIVIALALIGTVLPTVLAVLFWFAPERGMALSSHRLEQLPRVMSNRYAAIVIFALAALWQGEMGTIAFVTFVLTGTAFADTYIYMRAGRPFGPHLAAGLAGIVVGSLATVAHFKGSM